MKSFWNATRITKKGSICFYSAQFLHNKTMHLRTGDSRTFAHADWCHSQFADVHHTDPKTENSVTKCPPILLNTLSTQNTENFYSYLGYLWQIYAVSRRVHLAMSGVRHLWQQGMHILSDPQQPQRFCPSESSLSVREQKPPSRTWIVNQRQLKD